MRVISPTLTGFMALAAVPTNSIGHRGRHRDAAPHSGSAGPIISAESGPTRWRSHRMFVTADGPNSRGWESRSPLCPPPRALVCRSGPLHHSRGEMLDGRRTNLLHGGPGFITKDLEDAL